MIHQKTWIHLHLSCGWMMIRLSFGWMIHLNSGLLNHLSYGSLLNYGLQNFLNYGILMNYG